MIEDAFLDFFSRITLTWWKIIRDKRKGLSGRGGGYLPLITLVFSIEIRSIDRSCLLSHSHFDRDDRKLVIIRFFQRQSSLTGVPSSRRSRSRLSFSSDRRRDRLIPRNFQRREGGKVALSRNWEKGVGPWKFSASLETRYRMYVRYRLSVRIPFHSFCYSLSAAKWSSKSRPTLPLFVPRLVVHLLREKQRRTGREGSRKGRGRCSTLREEKKRKEWKEKKRRNQERKEERKEEREGGRKKGCRRGEVRIRRKSI